MVVVPWLMHVSNNINGRGFIPVLHDINSREMMGSWQLMRNACGSKRYHTEVALHYSSSEEVSAKGERQSGKMMSGDG